MSTVILTCQYCLQEFETLFKHRTRKFCSRMCVNLKQTGEGNPMFGRPAWTKETHPESAEKVRQTSIERGVNVGDKNGMKKPENRLKLSITRKKMMEDPAERKKLAIITAKAWADGKYDNAGVGRCKWYTYTKRDGTCIKCQGTWERAYAQYLDEQNISFTSHRGTLKYIDENNVQRTYMPDFWVEDWNCYIDIKGSHWMKLQHDVEIRIVGDVELHDIFGDDPKKLSSRWLLEFAEEKTLTD